MNPHHSTSRTTQGACCSSTFLLAGMLLAIAPAGRADEPTPAAVGATNAPTGLSTTRRARMASTPMPAIGEPLVRPVAVGSDVQTGAQVSSAPPHPGQDNRSNREAVQDAVDRGDRAVTPESSGGALRYLRRRPTWRGVWDLVDPRAPVASSVPSAGVGDVRREAAAVPASFRDPYRDPATHTATLRLF